MGSEMRGERWEVRDESETERPIIINQKITLPKAYLCTFAA